MTSKQLRDIFTPEQAAAYLQVNRETVYRYIRDGRLAASRLGRAYRIPKRSLDLLLWATRTRQDLTLRAYTGEEVAQFIEADTLDAEAEAIAGRFLRVAERAGAHRAEDLSQSRSHPSRC